jgi:ribose transport system permease protein
MNAQAVGANTEAAHRAGVRVDRVRRYGLLISALCAGIGGILLSAQVGSGEPTSGDGYLLSAFAAAFLGSVAFRNSEFHIVGTIIGVLTVGVAFNGLAIVGAQTFWQNVVQGGLLICAVGLSTVGRRLAER